ncbi:phage tail protein [Thiolapillus sp.]|uniref:phage tail protein n=1 Tax=Thiolapillus sp. TaxID=2017437 RepID=UPI003AF4F826
MIIDRFVAILGLDVKKGEFERGQQAVGRLKSGLKSLAAVAAAAFATFGAIGTARDVARLDAYAKAVGLSTDFLEHLGHSVAALGFDYEHVADMVEEMNNKIGESIGIAEMTPVKEALGILGLEFEKLSKMDRELQFRTVMNAAMELDDSQAASAAVDILVGSESSKITSYLRSSGKSFDELMQGYADGDAQTRKTREALIKLGQSVGKVGIMFGNLKRALLGFFAVALEPMTRGFVRLLKSISEFIHSGLEDHIFKIIAGVKLLVVTLGSLWVFGQRLMLLNIIRKIFRFGDVFDILDVVMELGRGLMRLMRLGGVLLSFMAASSIGNAFGWIKSLGGIFTKSGRAGRGFFAILGSGFSRLRSLIWVFAVGLLRPLTSLPALLALVGSAARGFFALLIAGFRHVAVAIALLMRIPGVVTAMIAVLVMAVQDLWTYFTDDEAVTLTGIMLNSIKAKWREFFSGIADATHRIINRLMDGWAMFKGWIFGLWDSFTTPVWDWITKETTAVIGQMKVAWDAFRNWIFGSWDSFSTPLWDWVTKETAAVIGQMEAAWEDFTAWVFAIWDSFEVPIWDWLIDSTAEAIDAIKSMWTDFTGWFSGIGDWMGETSSAAMAKIDSAIGGVKSFFGADEEQAVPDLTGVRAREIDVSGRSMLPPGLMPQSPTSYVTQSTSSAQTNNNTTTTNVDATINVNAGGMRAEELDRYVNEKLTETAGRSINLTGQPAW